MRCKTKGSDIDIQYFKSGETLPPEWDAFLPAGHFLKTHQIRFTETIKLPDVKFLYIFIQQNNKPIAAVYFQLLTLQQEHINNNMVKPWQTFAWRLFTNLANPKLLIAGHLFRHDISSFYWSPDMAPFDTYQYYMQAIDHARRISGAMAVLVKDTPGMLTTYFQNYAPQYLLLRNDISMEMEIPASWKTIADYEKALKHKYAQRMRKVRAEWNKLEIKELSVEEVIAYKEKIYRLYNQVSAHQQIRLGLLNADFIPALKQFYKDDLKVWVAVEDGQIVAFFSAWVKDDAFDMFYIGFDYERNKDLQTYFNMLYFSIEQAITLHKSKLILGRTALDAKARIGCKPRYLSTYLYIHNSFVRQRILSIQQKTTLQEGDGEDRHPFKNSLA